jgi:threonine synthase
VQERLGLAAPDRALAVASCGNAALAAAVVARAAERRLDVYIPPHADPNVVARLERLGVHLHICPRRSGESGDPCCHRFREAVDAGALPFTCQGNENGLVLDGGQTLALEIVRDAARTGVELDRLFVQVGGGALASACARGFEEARIAGVITRLPRLHAVQTEGAFPLVRAYDRVVASIEQRVRESTPGVAMPPDPGARAVFIREQVEPAHVEDVVRHAATHRSAFMQPWDREPRSLATGILDDETYDWLAVVRGMLLSGGYPVVASETALEEANRLAAESTGIAVDPTGTAGLAAALALRRNVALAADETVAVLFTGVRREEG